MDTNRSTKNEVVRQANQSRQSFQTVLARWLATYAEHYRQPLSKISVECYRENLSDLSAAELDAACRHALNSSEFMPTVATIRNALRDLRSIEEMPSTLIRYPEVSPEERAIDPEVQKRIDALKVKLGVGEPVKKYAPVKIFTPKSAPRSIEDQKAELRRRGLLK